MSDRREGGEEEGLASGNDKLIQRCSKHLHHADNDDDGVGQIYRKQQQQQPRVPLDQRKVKNKKGNSNSNRRKIQAKVKRFVLSRLRRFDKHLERTKNKTTAATTRSSTPPFPYNGEHFGGNTSRYLCFLRASPIRSGTAAAAETPSAANTAKPKHSSYYYFVKSLIEKNDFYSPESNAHPDIPIFQAK